MANEIDVRRLRQKLDWSQVELARHLGVHQSTVARMEGGGQISGPILRLLEQLEAAPKPTEAAE